MAYYRKKPVTVEAVRLGPSGFLERPEWLREAIDDGTVRTGPKGTRFIATLEGEMTVIPGDYVIRDVKGELYPIKEGIFWATYDPVEDGCA